MMLSGTRSRLTAHALVRDRPVPPPTPPSFVTPQISSSSSPSHALGLFSRKLAAAQLAISPPPAPSPFPSTSSVVASPRRLTVPPRRAARALTVLPRRAACALAMPLGRPTPSSPRNPKGQISVRSEADLWDSSDTFETQKLNQVPTLDELFRHTYQKKKDGNQWVNKRAETTYINFTQKWQEVQSNQSSIEEDGAESSQQHPQPSMMYVWKEIVGVNKG
ncbi:uncharacterized protein [Elaeis guineensis]|uniref:uncharacterized protein n=1 Tax=Elaeis guineensis var. tenera TaxID=51953 RepID=UPI003C6D0BBB